MIHVFPYSFGCPASLSGANQSETHIKKRETNRRYKNTQKTNKQCSTHAVKIRLWSPGITHTTTQSHWSSGSTIGFPPRGPAVGAPGVHPQCWNWDLQLVKSRYIGDPDIIPDHWTKGPL